MMMGFFSDLRAFMGGRAFRCARHYSLSLSLPVRKQTYCMYVVSGPWGALLFVSRDAVYGFQSTLYSITHKYQAQRARPRMLCD